MAPCTVVQAHKGKYYSVKKDLETPKKVLILRLKLNRVALYV